MTTCWKLWTALVEAIKAGAVDRALLYGPPGTGKTRAAVDLAASLGAPLHIYTCTADAPSDAAVGFFVPTGQQGLAWRDGPLTRALRHGGVLVLDELDQVSPDLVPVLMAISADSDQRRLALPSGEVVAGAGDKPLTIIATQNGDPQDLPAAIRSRFCVRLLCDEWHPDLVASLPPALQPAVRDISRAGYTSRELMAFSRLIAAGWKVTDAAAVTMPDCKRALTEALAVSEV